MKLTRKGFLTTVAGAAAASWLDLPFTKNALMAADIADANGENGDYPLYPLHPWIATYQPATGKFDPQKAQTFKLDWMFWQFFIAKKQPAEVVNIGNLVIQRRPSAHSIDYQITQTRDVRVLTAKINCQADPIESVQTWSVEESYPKPTWSKDVGGKFSTQTTGRIEGGKAYLTRGKREIIVPLDGPLICSWALMANPGIAKELAAQGKSFTLADQMSVLRPGHTVKPDIEVSVPNSARCATYRVIGHGSPPIHVVVNPEIGALFSTIYLTSATLRSIENNA